MDLEAVAFDGETAFWIASHAVSRRGKRSQSREQIVVTHVGDSGQLTLERTSPSGLLEALEADARYGAAAYEIEAASFSEGGVLWLGFREPRVEGNALIAPLLAPVDLRQPTLGDPIHLDLGGAGLRAMASLGDRRWLLAADGLYLWDGERAPKFWRETPWQIEALAIDREARRIVLISDDGRLEIDGKPCKTLEEGRRRFRMRWIEWPEQVY